MELVPRSGWQKMSGGRLNQTLSFVACADRVEFFDTGPNLLVKDLGMSLSRLQQTARAAHTQQHESWKSATWRHRNARHTLAHPSFELQSTVSRSMDRTASILASFMYPYGKPYSDFKGNWAGGDSHDHLSNSMLLTSCKHWISCIPSVISFTQVSCFVFSL